MGSGTVAVQSALGRSSCCHNVQESVTVKLTRLAYSGYCLKVVTSEMRKVLFSLGQSVVERKKVHRCTCLPLFRTFPHKMKAMKERHDVQAVFKKNQVE